MQIHPHRLHPTTVTRTHRDLPSSTTRTSRASPQDGLSGRPRLFIASTVVCTSNGDGNSGASIPASDYRIPAITFGPIVAVLQFAFAQLGKPYVLGATGPDAYDCSGLVQAAYGSIGVNLPRTTYQQVRVGTPVYDLTQLQPGDLIFIPGSDGIPTNPGHGLYLGSGLIEEAPHTGDVIKIIKLSAWADTNSIVAMRRISR
jgi:cell wall-associated NlpC family hydrolase